GLPARSVDSTERNRPVPPFVMDRPVLYPLASELAESERLGAFADDLEGASARVSEPALPLVLAALHLRLGRPLVALLPEDADARDAAEAATWFLGEERVALLPSRGVSWASGLEPPPHLVGERARALDVLAGGGLVCASAAALAELLPPAEARPQRIDLAAGDEPRIEGLAETLTLAGYERVDRVEDRGQFAVRGGLVDVFPTTGREPLRIELFGDEIEAIRAFSPFTQRALHPVERAAIYPAAERRVDLLEPTLEAVPHDLVPVLDRAPDLVFEPDEVRRVWEEEQRPPVPFGRAALLDPFPRGQRHAVAAWQPAGSPRPSRSSARSYARSSAWSSPSPIAATRSGRPTCCGGCPSSGSTRTARFRKLQASTSRSRRRGAASSGATSASSSSRTRRSSASVRRAPAHASGARCSRSPTFAPATTSFTRTTGSGSCSASRRRRSRG